MLQHADAIVHDDDCITTQQLALILSIKKPHHLRSLIFEGMRKMGSSEPHGPKHKTKRNVISSELWAHFEAEGQTFLSWIVNS
jgi:hypothetical protein